MPRPRWAICRPRWLASTRESSPRCAGSVWPSASPPRHSSKTPTSAEEQGIRMTTLFTSDHEWLQIEGDVATIGITDYAQSQLGDVVFVELPKVGRQLKQAEAA